MIRIVDIIKITQPGILDRLGWWDRPGNRRVMRASIAAIMDRPAYERGPGGALRQKRSRAVIK